MSQSSTAQTKFQLCVSCFPSTCWMHTWGSPADSALLKPLLLFLLGLQCPYRRETSPAAAEISHAEHGQFNPQKNESSFYWIQLFCPPIVPFSGKIEAVPQTPLKHQPVISHWTPCLAFRLTLGFLLSSGPHHVSKGSPSQKEEISRGWLSQDPQTGAQMKPRIRIVTAQWRNDVSLKLNFSTSKTPLIISLLDHATRETCCARNSTAWVIQTPLMKLIFNLKIPCNPRKFTTNPKGLLCLRKKESRHELSFLGFLQKKPKHSIRSFMGFNWYKPWCILKGLSKIPNRRITVFCSLCLPGSQKLQILCFLTSYCQSWTPG